MAKFLLVLVLVVNSYSELNCLNARWLTTQKKEGVVLDSAYFVETYTDLNEWSWKISYSNGMLDSIYVNDFESETSGIKFFYKDDGVDSTIEYLEINDRYDSLDFIVETVNRFKFGELVSKGYSYQNDSIWVRWVHYLDEPSENSITTENIVNDTLWTTSVFGADTSLLYTVKSSFDFCESYDESGAIKETITLTVGIENYVVTFQRPGYTREFYYVKEVDDIEATLTISGSVKWKRGNTYFDATGKLNYLDRPIVRF